MENNAEIILKALSGLRLGRNIEEMDIHAAIAQSLDKEDIEYRHEYRLKPHCRLDFLVGSIAIEVKKGRPVPSSLVRQISNYLQDETLTGIIVVTQHSVKLPQSLFGKQIHQIALDRLWGVSLP